MFPWDPRHLSIKHQKLSGEMRTRGRCRGESYKKVMLYAQSDADVSSVRSASLTIQIRTILCHFRSLMQQFHSRPS
jgi:hypothetical protein